MVMMVTWRWSLRSSWTGCTSSLVFDVSPFSVISPTTLGFSVLGSLQGHFPSLHKDFHFCLICSKDYNWWLSHGLFKIVLWDTQYHINNFDVVSFIQKEILYFYKFCSSMIRFVRVHDLPGLLAAALQNQPWRRNGWKHHFSWDLVASLLWGFVKRWAMRLVLNFYRYKNMYLIL